MEAYGFSGICLQIMRTYLKNCIQRANVKSSFNEWETITGVPQGSILDPHYLTFS